MPFNGPPELVGDIVSMLGDDDMRSPSPEERAGTVAESDALPSRERDDVEPCPLVSLASTQTRLSPSRN